VKHSLSIGIIGDYNPKFRIHTATNEALDHAATALDVHVDPMWLPTPSFDEPVSTLKLQEYDALWCSAGSPYASMAGALTAIRFARERNWPFFAT
jgi:CTP synthase (UTP-ammonia lyase)